MVVEATSYRYGTGRPVGAPKFGSGATTATLIPNANDDMSSTCIDLTAYDSMSRDDDEERDDGVSTSTDWQHSQRRTNNRTRADSASRPTHDQNLNRLLDGINDMVVRESPFSLAATLSGDDGVPIHVWESTTHTVSSTLEKPAPVIRLWDAETPPRPEHPASGLTRYQKALVRLDGVRRKTTERSATVAKDTDILSTKHEHLIQQNRSLQSNHSLHRQTGVIIDVLDDDDADNRGNHVRSGASSSRGRISNPSTPSSRLFIDTSAMETAYETQSRYGGATSGKDFMTAFSYEFKTRMPDQPVDVIYIDDILEEEREMTETALTPTTPRSATRLVAPCTPERFSGIGSSQSSMRRHQQATTGEIPATRRKLPITNSAVLLALSRSPPSSPRSQSSSEKKGRRVPTQRSLDLQRDKITAIRNTVKTLQQQKGGLTSSRQGVKSPMKQQQQQPGPSGHTPKKGGNGDIAKLVNDSVASGTSVATIEKAPNVNATLPSQNDVPSDVMATVSNGVSPADPSHSVHKEQDSPADCSTRATGSSTENLDDAEFDICRRKNEDEIANRIQHAFAAKVAEIQKDSPKTDQCTLFDEKESNLDLPRLVSDTLDPSNESKPNEQHEAPSPDEHAKPASPQNSLWIRNLQYRLAAKEENPEPSIQGETDSVAETFVEPSSQIKAVLSSEVATAEDPLVISVSTDVREDSKAVDAAAKTPGNIEVNDNMPDSIDLPHDHVMPADPEISEESAPDTKLERLGEQLEMALVATPIEGTATNDGAVVDRKSGVLEQITPSITVTLEATVENSQETINSVAEIREDEKLDAVFESGSCEKSQTIFKDDVRDTKEDETSLTVTSVTMEDSFLPTETESWTHPEDRKHNANKFVKSPRTRRESDEKKHNERDAKPSSKKESEGSGSDDNVSFVTDLSASKVSIVDSETTDSEMEEEPETYGPCSGLPFAIQLLDVTCAWLEKEETSFCFQPSLLKKVTKRDDRRSDKHNPSRPVMTSRIPRSAALSRCFGDSKKQETETKFMRPKPTLKSATRVSNRSSGSRAHVDVLDSAKKFTFQNLTVIDVPIDKRSVDAMETTEVVVTPTRSNVTKQLEAQQSEDTGPFAPNEGTTLQRPIIFDGSFGRTESDDAQRDDEFQKNPELADEATQEKDEATSSFEQTTGSSVQLEKSEIKENATLESEVFLESPRNCSKSVTDHHETEISLEAPVSVMSDEITLKKGNQTPKIASMEAVSITYNDVVEMQSEQKGLDEIIEAISVEEQQTSQMCSFKQLRAKSLSPPSKNPNVGTGSADGQSCLYSTDGSLSLVPVLLTSEPESSPSHSGTNGREIRLVRSMGQVPIGPDKGSEDGPMKTDTVRACPSESSVEEVDSLFRYRSRRECLAKLKKQLPRTTVFDGGATTPKSLSENYVSTFNVEQRHAAMELAEKLRRRATTLTRRRKIRDRRKELRVLVTTPPTSPTSTQGFSDNSV